MLQIIRTNSNEEKLFPSDIKGKTDYRQRGRPSEGNWEEENNTLQGFCLYNAGSPIGQAGDYTGDGQTRGKTQDIVFSPGKPSAKKDFRRNEFE
ncbi:MAG: hypothetical protein IJ773_04765 [Lachnospiraceae bacterium]|nr:hypothetical protein [Lachnospiraceae bacterium]